jgi:hypothetical protein
MAVWGYLCLLLLMGLSGPIGISMSQLTYIGIGLALSGMVSAIITVGGIEEDLKEVKNTNKFKRTKDYRISWDGEKITARPLSFKPAKFEEEENEDE